jgi:hypothetical protein
MANEIFDGDELYAVLQQKIFRLFFIDKLSNSPVSTTVYYDDYFSIWHEIRSDLARKIEQPL